MIVTASHTGFQRVSWTTRGCVTPCCRLLVVAWSLHLVILFFKECLQLSRGVLLFVVGCLLCCDRYIWSYWFSKMTWTLQECVTLCCRLLLIMWLLRLVILVFKEWLELHGGVLLLDVGCWLLCDCYIWSPWFLTPLDVHAFCTASGYGFLAVSWVVGVI